MTARYLAPAMILAILVAPVPAAVPQGPLTLVQRLEKALKGEDRPSGLVIQIDIKAGSEAEVEAAFLARSTIAHALGIFPQLSTAFALDLRQRGDGVATEAIEIEVLLPMLQSPAHEHAALVLAAAQQCLEHNDLST
jgi:hypothetical protein